MNAIILLSTDHQIQWTTRERWTIYNFSWNKLNNKSNKEHWIKGKIKMKIIKSNDQFDNNIWIKTLVTRNKTKVTERKFYVWSSINTWILEVYFIFQYTRTCNFKSAMDTNETLQKWLAYFYKFSALYSYQFFYFPFFFI